MARECSTCKYYWEHDHTVSGRVPHPHCRRYPPVHIGPTLTNYGFVHVLPDLWCGEYNKRRA